MQFHTEMVYHGSTHPKRPSDDLLQL